MGAAVTAAAASASDAAAAAAAAAAASVGWNDPLGRCVAAAVAGIAAVTAMDRHNHSAASAGAPRHSHLLCGEVPPSHEVVEVGLVEAGCARAIDQLDGVVAAAKGQCLQQMDSASAARSIESIS